MTSLFTNLREHLEMTPLNDDQVKVSLVLPSDILVDFIQVLDSLTDLLKPFEAEPVSPSTTIPLKIPSQSSNETSSTNVSSLSTISIPIRD